MKFATLFSTALIATLLLTVSASAQQGLQHPTEEGAQLIGTYPVALTMPKVGEKKGADVVTDILVWATSGGQKELQLAPAVQATGGEITIPTSMLYGMLSQAAVSKAALLGYIQPTATPMNVPVYRPNYATPTATGLASCGDESWGVANYTVSMPVGGTLVVNLDDVEYETEFVSGSCQSTFVDPVQSSVSSGSSTTSTVTGAAMLTKSAKLDRIRERIRARRAARLTRQ
ncbi:MAG: hypothetical protein JNJ94_11945 [Chlorobi bacterium]|nr:hypothetical protein [Chlorobiota bacterium]